MTRFPGPRATTETTVFVSTVQVASQGVVSGHPTQVGGDQVALDFDIIYREYARYVAAIGIRLLGRDDEVDDLIQDVFMEAHRGLHRLQDPRAIKGWLATITVRTATRRLRKRRMKAALRLDRAADYERCAAPDAGPEERSHVASVYRILDELPAKQRIQWVLRFVQGETLESVAALTGCSMSTVQRGLRAAQKVIDAGLEGKLR